MVMASKTHRRNIFNSVSYVCVKFLVVEFSHGAVSCVDQQVNKYSESKISATPLINQYNFVYFSIRRKLNNNKNKRRNKLPNRKENLSEPNTCAPYHAVQTWHSATRFDIETLQICWGKEKRLICTHTRKVLKKSGRERWIQFDCSLYNGTFNVANHLNFRIYICVCVMGHVWLPLPMCISFLLITYPFNEFILNSVDKIYRTVEWIRATNDIH